jgi:hypothetical protein
MMATSRFRLFLARNPLSSGLSLSFFPSGNRNERMFDEYAIQRLGRRA